MSTEEQVSRTNYFKVKDRKKFEEFAENFISTVEIVQKDDDPELVAMLMEDGTPSTTMDDEDVDFMQELSKHLAEGQVAVLLAVWREKMRHLGGYAEAVDHTGKSILIRTDDIYEMAKKEFPGAQISRAEY